MTTALEEALNDAISSGRFIDTKIVLFSRRDGAGRICKPRALYANSHVLKSVPYFKDLLFGTFAEAEVKDFSETYDDELAEDYGYSSDSDLEEDSEFRGPSPVAIPDSEAPPIDSPGKETPCGKYEEKVLAGKVIKVQDVAFITFQAFLLYLYTESINFAPFGSEGNRKSRSSEIVSTLPGNIPKPSPKSIYRLADKYDIPDLKRLALNRIQKKLDSCDIVRETFSVFTSRYDEIRIMQVNHLVSVWLSGNEEKSQALHKKLDEKIEKYAAGELEHAAEAIFSIWVSAHKHEALPSVNDSARRNPHWPTGPGERSMRMPLIQSMRGESLLHRKYWGRRSKGRTMGLIYLPGPVSGLAFSQVDAQCDSGADSYSEENGEYSLSEDSDYESESEGDSDPVSGDAEVGHEREQTPLPVLKIGSLTTWKSLIFYLCTGKIQFAPLKSQGSAHRSQWKLENTKPGSPVPCSPKSIYALAKKLKIAPLIGLAFRDIEAKITKKNVMIEIFSKFALQQSEIMVMGWKYSNAELKAEKVNGSIREVVQGMAGGNAPHQADALKFGLYNVLRREGSTNRSLTRLRCRDEACEARRQPVSYASLGNSITCPKHSARPDAASTKIMECSGCGHARTDHCTWCKGCRRMFG